VGCLYLAPSEYEDEEEEEDEEEDVYDSQGEDALRPGQGSQSPPDGGGRRESKNGRPDESCELTFLFIFIYY